MAEFKVMTWNVENLFQPQAGDPIAEVEQYEAKLAFLALVIEEEAPDVVAFQELGGDEELVDLQQVLEGYPHRATSAFGDGRHIRVGMLSKLAIDQTEDIVNFPAGPALRIFDLKEGGATPKVTRMSRGALRIRVSKAGMDIHVITAHLKSKLLSYPRPGALRFTPATEAQRAQIGGIALHKRTAEAVTLRLRINSFLTNNATSPLVLMGDFNDVPEAQTSLLLCGPSGSEIGTGGFDRPDKGDDARMFNLAPLIAADRRFSRIHSGRPELLDQVYASEELLPIQPDKKRRRPMVDSLVDFRDRLPSVSDDPNLRTDDIAPDHAPVVAVFEV